MTKAVKQPALERLPVMVVSHERSGTHFLMNSIAAEFGFISHPPLAMDPPVVNINFFHPPSIEKFFDQHRETKPEHVRKSHHQFSFFQPVIESVLSNIRIFYIYRDPRDMLHSFRHFLNSWGWFEGPKVADADAFIRTPPTGQMLRYQFHQTLDMLDRWRMHVDSWVDAASRHESISLVKYEDLQANFDCVMDRIAEETGWRRTHRGRPQMDQKTVLRSKQGDPSNHYSEDATAYFEQKAGPTMRRLGYEI